MCRIRGDESSGRLQRRARGAMSAKKDTAIELKACIDQAVRVKLAGGREGG